MTNSTSGGRTFHWHRKPNVITTHIDGRMVHPLLGERAGVRAGDNLILSNLATEQLKPISA
jgi:hypothetical protein